MNDVTTDFIRANLHFRSVPEALLEVVLKPCPNHMRTILDTWQDWLGATHEAGHAVIAADTGIDPQWIDTDPWGVHVIWPQQRAQCYSMLAAGGAATQLCVEDCGYPQVAKDAGRRSAGVDARHLRYAYKGKAKKYVPKLFEEMDRIVEVLRADELLRGRIDSLANRLYAARQDGLKRLLRSEFSDILG